MKKHLSLFIALVLTASLVSGCAANPGTATTTTTAGTPTTSEATQTQPQPAEKVKLTYWALSRWSGINGTEPDGQVGDWQRDVAKRFMEENPNVESVEFEHIPAADIEQKLTVAVASSTQPDVLEDGATRAGRFARMGVLLPLNDYFTKEEMDDALPGSWENGGIKVDGQYHMIPWSNSVQFMLINRSLFEKAGALSLLPANEEKSWTYEQFRAALEAVKSKDVYPCSFFFGSTAGDAYLYDILMGSGARLFDDSGSFAFNSIETAQGLEYVVSLLEAGLSVPGAETLKYSDDKELFKQQKTAVCFMGGTAYYAQLKQEMEAGTLAAFDLGWALYPNAEGKTPGLEANYIGYMVFKSGNSAREAAAVELAKFATNTENSKALKIVNLIPLRESCGDLYPGDELAAWQKQVFQYAKDPGYGLDLYSKATGEVIPMMQALATGSKSVIEGLAELEKTVAAQ